MSDSINGLSGENFGWLLSNMSVVSAYATANFMFPELERVYNYFLKQWLPILLPKTDLKTWTTGEMEAEKENKSFLLDLLHRADFNISGFDVQQNEKISAGCLPG